MSRHRRRRRPRAATAEALRVTDPDLVALYGGKSPEGRAVLVRLQEARDQNRAAQLVKPPPPGSSLYDLDDLDQE